MDILNVNIKQEPEVEFTLVLKPFQPERTLKGDVELEKLDPGAETFVNPKVKSIRRLKNISESYICDFCGKTEKLRSRLHEHLYKHIKPFKCECGKSFSSKNELKKHKLTHDNNRPTFNCMLCSLTYKKKQALKKHLDVLHFTIGEKFKCVECDYEGKSSEHLKYHQGTHTKPFKCNKCEKGFSRNQNLKNHLKKHEGPDEFICPCSKVFKSSAALITHKSRMHKTGEPIEIFDGTYGCRVCHKQFSIKRNLVTHMKVHEAKQKCPICSEMLAVLSLKHHIRRHELKKGEKKFICSECSNAFLTSMDLKRHSRIHGKQCVCDLCGQRFAIKHCIQKHVMTHINRYVA